MTLTVGQINEMREEFLKTWNSDSRFVRLCDLALIGAAVQPRPISEAPKDGTFILGVLESGHKLMLQFGELESGWRRDAYDRMVWRPTHFYDLSALPKPKEPT